MGSRAIRLLQLSAAKLPALAVPLEQSAGLAPIESIGPSPALCGGPSPDPCGARRKATLAAGIRACCARVCESKRRTPKRKPRNPEPRVETHEESLETSSCGGPPRRRPGEGSAAAAGSSALVTSCLQFCLQALRANPVIGLWAQLPRSTRLLPTHQDFAVLYASC